MFILFSGDGGLVFGNQSLDHKFGHALDSRNKPSVLVKRECYVRIGKPDLRASEDESVRMVERSATQEGCWEREAMPGLELADCDPT